MVTRHVFHKSKEPQMTTNCKQHFYQDVMMECPWPNCPNGTHNDNTICIVDRTKPYKRIKWENIDGEDRYFWHSDNDFMIYSVYQLVQSEIFRLQSEPSIIYHYTDINGLYEIVKSKTFWLSDYSYLNDSKEIEHGLEIFFNIAEKYSSKDNYPMLDEFIDYVKTEKRPRICISCFSSNGDSLSQWRGYGHNGKRVSIGITPKTLISGIPRETRIGVVIYKKDLQVKIIQHFIHYYCLAYLRDRNKHTDIEQLNETYKGIMLSKLYDIIVFMKDKAFADEKEYRLVYIEQEKLFNSCFFKKARKYFRVSNGIIVPYVSLKKINKSSNAKFDIEKIIIGPQENSELVLKSISEYLEYNGYNNVKVVPSKVPFR